MELIDFYIFQQRLSQSTMHFNREGVTMPFALKLIKGDYEDLSFPIVFKQDSGVKMADVMALMLSLHFVSQKFVQILEENNFTGWKTYPVKLYTKQNEEITNYHGFSITGKSSKIDWSKSEIFEKKRVPHGPIVQFYKGMHTQFVNNTSFDIFIPEGTTFIIISKKLKDLLVKNKITNIEFMNLQDFEMMVN